jgi:rubrerythrin
MKRKAGNSSAHDPDSPTERRREMKERLNALEVALNNELQEHRFYLEHARKTDNPVGRAMFEQIAAEEMEHYARLRELHGKWLKEEKWPETVPLKVRNTVVKDVLAKMIREAGQGPAGDKGDLEALETAIEFEANGALYYARLRDQVADSHEKAFFNLLADIEHEHFVSLKDTMEYLTDPVGWFRIREKGGLDGG